MIFPRRSDTPVSCLGSDQAARVALATLLIVILACGLMRDASAKPAILWEPKTIEATVESGASVTTIYIWALSTQSFDTLDVFVAPEIRPFVSISPSSIFVSAGVPTLFTLEVSAPVGEPAGMYDGTIHLLDGSSTIARPLPVIVKIGEGIGVGGGVARSNDGNATLVIPEGALSEATVITVESTDSGAFPPDWGVLTTPAFDFGPDGTVFNTPATLIFAYTPDDIPAGFTAEDLRIGYENDFLEVVGLENCAVNTDQQTVTCPVWHFTKFIMAVAADQVAPAAPTNVSMDFADATLQEGRLDWVNPGDEDFDHVKVYRSNTVGVLGEAIATDIRPFCDGATGCSVGPTYDVPLSPGFNCFVVRSVDRAGNESDNPADQANQRCIFKL